MAMTISANDLPSSSFDADSQARRQAGAHSALIPSPIVGLDHSQTDFAVIRNLAIDEALLESAEDQGVSAVRIWRQSQFAAILGASCRLPLSLNVEACRSDGVVIARRSSGGGTVLIGPGALNVAAVWPIDAAPELRAVDAAQRFMMDRIAQELRGSGAEPSVEVLGSGDLTIGGRKCAGSAQRRSRRFFLVHASLLVRFDLGRIERYLPLPPKQPEYRRDRPHRDFVVNFTASEAAIIDAVRRAWLGPDASWGEGPIPEDRVAAIMRGRLDDPAWIERF